MTNRLVYNPSVAPVLSSQDIVKYEACVLDVVGDSVVVAVSSENANAQALTQRLSYVTGRTQIIYRTVEKTSIDRFVQVVGAGPRLQQAAVPEVRSERKTVPVFSVALPVKGLSELRMDDCVAPLLSPPLVLASDAIIASLSEDMAFAAGADTTKMDSAFARHVFFLTGRRQMGIEAIGLEAARLVRDYAHFMIEKALPSLVG